MWRARVLGAVILFSTVASCSDPTTVQPPAQPARFVRAPSADVNVVHVASGERGVMGVFNGVTVYGSGYESAVAFAPNGSCVTKRLRKAGGITVMPNEHLVRSLRSSSRAKRCQPRGCSGCRASQLQPIDRLSSTVLSSWHAAYHGAGPIPARTARAGSS